MTIQEDIAPSGPLRVAINIGNAVLASGDEETGKVSGITPEIAKILSAELGLPMEVKIFKSAGSVVEAASEDVWDIAFAARDPKRAETITFTEPYIIIEGAYLVRNFSPIQTNEEVDQKGNRVAVGKGAAYDLHLSRTLQHATLERAPTTPTVVDLFLEKDLEVAAGVRQPLIEFAETRDDLRVLPGRFMVIEQTIAVPKGRTAAHEYLQGFVTKLISEGHVARLIKQFDKNQASVPLIR